MKTEKIVATALTKEREEIIALLRETLGEGIHTAFRRGGDMRIWEMIRGMDDAEWHETVCWLADGLASVIRARNKIQEPALTGQTYIALSECPGAECLSAIRELSCHCWHCPICDEHLTSGLLCPVCGIRYQIVVILTEPQRYGEPCLFCEKEHPE